MSMLYVVLPLLPDEKDDVVAWLGELGIACPGGESRYPTIVEICSVLDHLDGYTTHYSTDSTGRGNWYAEVSQTDQVKSDWAFLVVSNYSGNDADSHAFCFEHGSPLVMMLILQRLARTCGPLILLPDTGHFPLVVTSELDLDQALHEWES